MSPKKMLTPLAVLALSLTAFAQEKSEVQSAARPYDLDIVGPVMVAGSDEASKQFQYEALPTLTEYSAKYFAGSKAAFLSAEEIKYAEEAEYSEEAAKEKRAAAEKSSSMSKYERESALPSAEEAKYSEEEAKEKREAAEKSPSKSKYEIQPIKGGGVSFFDPAKLVLGSDYAARAYFIGENSDFRNTLGFSTTGSTPFSKDAALIFPNASSYEQYGKEHRAEEAPLLAGDFVELGNLKQGTLLDFFLIANGAEKPQGFFSTDISLNEDGMTHAVAMALDGSPYLLIGFSDIMKGGGKGFNDAVFAIDIGAKNMQLLKGLGAPEPSLAAGGLLALATIFGRKRRR